MEMPLYDSGKLPCYCLPPRCLSPDATRSKRLIHRQKAGVRPRQRSAVDRRQDRHARSVASGEPPARSSSAGPVGGPQSASTEAWPEWNPTRPSAHKPVAGSKQERRRHCPLLPQYRGQRQNEGADDQHGRVREGNAGHQGQWVHRDPHAGFPRVAPRRKGNPGKVRADHHR